MTARPAVVAGTIVAVLAGLVWIVQLATLSDLSGSDPPATGWRGRSGVGRDGAAECVVLADGAGSRGRPLEALAWLAGHGCDTDTAVSEAEALVRAYQDSPGRTAMLARLGGLHRKP